MGCNCSKNNNEYLLEMLNDTKENISNNESDLKTPSYENKVINYEEEKQKLIEKLSLKGNFSNENIKLILENINDKVNSMEIPNDILEKNKNENIINLPLIKMNDGEIYEGNWNLEGEKEGFGISIFNNKKIYKGFWKKGKFDNYGILFNNKDNYYKGQFVEGFAKGKGELLINNKIKYISEFDNNLPNGNGEIIYLEDEINYIGNIVNGIKDGFGILKFKDGTIYEGEFKEDKYNGKGKIIYSDNSEYEGEFLNNLKNGKGIFKWDDGKIFEGEFKNDKKHGKGKFIFKENIYYEGYWINDLAHGKGLYNINGKKFVGIFKYGKMIIEKNQDSLKE